MAAAFWRTPGIQGRGFMKESTNRKKDVHGGRMCGLKICKQNNALMVSKQKLQTYGKTCNEYIKIHNILKELLNNPKLLVITERY